MSALRGQLGWKSPRFSGHPDFQIRAEAQK
jgi:hypothetical protein